jgi:hypothetical protein
LLSASCDRGATGSGTFRPATTTVQGRVWKDLDRDGIRQSEEEGLGLVTVRALGGGGATLAETTSSVVDGTYMLVVDELRPFSITVVQSSLPPNHEPSPRGAPTTDEGRSDGSPFEVTNQTGNDELVHVDFGYTWTGHVRGVVWREEVCDGSRGAGEAERIAGVRLGLLDSEGEVVEGPDGEPLTAVSNGSGAYVLELACSGEYQVVVDPTSVFPDLTPAPATTGGGAPGSVRVMDSEPEVVDVDFGFCERRPPTTILGRVWKDLDRDGIFQEGEPGLGPVAVRVLDDEGAAVAETTSDGDDGTYTLTVTVPRPYSVVVDAGTLPASFTPSPQAGSPGDEGRSDGSPFEVTDQTGDDELAHVDFGYTWIGHVRGVVWLEEDCDGIRDDAEAGRIAGATLQLLDEEGDAVEGPDGEPVTAVSDASGAYVLELACPGDYTVVVDPTSVSPKLTPAPVPSGGQAPGSVQVLGSAPELADVDFGFCGGDGVIGDLVWNDRDQDGIQDDGEPGLPARVFLQSSATGLPVDETTTVGGHYEFTELCPGTYEVRAEPLQQRFLPSPCDQGTDDALDSECVPYVVTLPERDSAELGADFGFFRSCDGELVDLDDLAAGAIVERVFGDGGAGPVLVSGSNPSLSGANAAIVFDSASPTGGDPDLGTPHVDFGGPGIGDGGAAGSPFENGRPLQRVLIVAEDLDDEDGDGLVDDPGDAAGPDNTLTFDFSMLGTATVCSLTVLDIESNESTGTVLLYDALGALLGTVVVTPVGDNGVGEVDLGKTSGVARMVVEMGGSGAIDELCFVPEPCATCSGGVTALALRWMGAAPATIDVLANGVVFSDEVEPGEPFSFVGDDQDGTLGAQVDVYVDGALAETIPTDCSEPIGPGRTFGDFEVVGGTSRLGGLLCDEDDPEEPGGEEVCAEGTKPSALTLVYTGEDCSASSHGQPGSKVDCSGDPASASRVHVVAHDDKKRTYFDGPVDLDVPFEVSAGFAGKPRLGADLRVDVYDESGAMLLQSVKFHTSCSLPLAVGDRFGSIELIGFDLD